MPTYQLTVSDVSDDVIDVHCVAASGVLGDVWHTTSPVSTGALSFTTPISPDDTYPVWRVSLPTNATQQATYRLAQDLSTIHAHIAQTARTLPLVEHKLTHLAQHIAPTIQSPAMSFDTTKNVGITAQQLKQLAPAERELVLSLMPQEAHTEQFGLFDGLDKLTQRWKEIQTFVEQLYHSRTLYAVIETDNNGQLLARTEVGWMSDVHTTWYGRIASSDIHQRNMSLALASQQQLIHTFVVIMHGMAALSMLIATGGMSAILAPTRILNYVDRLLKELPNGK